MQGKRAKQSHISASHRGRPAEHDEIDRRERSGREPEALPDDSLQATAVHRSACALLGDRQPETRRPWPTDPGEDREVGVGRAQRACEDAAELVAAAQPQAFGQTTVIVPLTRSLGAAQGISLARPLARRAASTLRPLRVAMRARNPWVRARLRRLGWKVLFMVWVRRADDAICA